MARTAWEWYVARLCLDSWSLEPAALVKLMADIEALIATRYVTDTAIATVLRIAGAPTGDAELVAPTIRAAIGGDDGSSHPRPPVM